MSQDSRRCSELLCMSQSQMNREEPGTTDGEVEVAA